MPTYQYECKKCKHKFEEMKTISKRDEAICPKCGNKDNTRFIGTGSGFIFKGSGFYETDYKRDKVLGVDED
jgi:putative FmdB family regulatory protein